MVKLALPARSQARLQPVEWRVAPGLTGYESACQAMEDRARAIAEESAGELVWLVEHPAIYTAGTSAKLADLLDAGRFPVHRTGRGGQYTYHGPGQRVAYVMLDVGPRYGDVRAFVCALEDWIITALDALGVKGERRNGRIGIWVARPDRGPGSEDKVAAIGIRLRKWVSFHGIALNVAPDLSHYTGIVPCGISDHGVTSLADLGLVVPMAAVDEALKAAFVRTIAPVTRGVPAVSPSDAA